jgi:hypothetical protein
VSIHGKLRGNTLEFAHPRHHIGGIPGVASKRRVEKNLALTENLTSNGLDVNASAKAMMKPHEEFFNSR